MDHFAFIAWAYAGVFMLVLTIVAYVAWDARRVAARLTMLAGQGIRRRSSSSETSAT